MVSIFTTPGGITIVVVLLVAVQADIQQQCQQLGILCKV
jgi:hypothetical protein